MRKHIAINVIGSYLGLVFAVFYTVFLVRAFDPATFGTLTLLLVMSYVLANILNMGMPASIYAHLPDLLGKRKELLSYVKTNFSVLVVLSSAVLAIAYLLRPLSDAMIFKQTMPSYLYVITLVGAGMYIWQNFIQDVLLASKRTLTANIAVNLANATRTILLILMVITGQTSLGLTLFIMGICGPSAYFIFVAFSHRSWIKDFAIERLDRSTIKTQFTFLYFLSSQIYQLSSRIDIFMVAYFLSQSEVGYYGLAQRITLAIVTSSDSITQILSPQFSTITTQKSFRELFRKSCLAMLVPTAAFLCTAIIPSFIFTFFFSNAYFDAINIIRLLCLSYLPYSFLAVSMLFLLYTLKKPGYVLFINSISLFIKLVGDYFSISYFNLTAIPLINVLNFAVTGSIIYIIIKRELKSMAHG